MTQFGVAWLSAFVCTAAVELVVATPLLAPSGARWLRRAAVVVVANLATHPIVWFVLPDLWFPNDARLVTSELFAIAIESSTYGLVWPELGIARVCAVAALANGASLGVGLLLRASGVPV